MAAPNESSDESEVFYDPIDLELISPRRSSKRLSTLVPLSGNSIVEPVSPAVMSPDKTRPASPSQPIPIIITSSDDKLGHDGRDNEEEVGTSREASSIEDTDGDDSATRGSRISQLQLDEKSEATDSTLLRTLELSAQSRTQKVKVKTKGRGSRADLMDLHLVQQLTCPSSTTIFALEFSPDGVYLAAACADGVVRVWAAISEQISEEEMGEHGEIRTAALFSCEPVQCFTGHEGEVLDISWSSNNFLISASTDATVRLWSPTRPDCLAVFPHTDIVTCISFHPTDDRRFISGSFDCRIHLWNIEEKKVVAWNELPAENVVTAVGWSGGGRYALAGSSTGVLLFFETEGFKYYTQILVKSSRGKNSVGKKISSIAIKPGSAMEMSPPLTSAASSGTGKRRVDDQTILVSSNDSRLRAYLLRDKSESVKYTGHTNESSQIKASYSDDAEYIISGSEDGRCMVWSVEPPKLLSFGTSSHKRVDGYEYFQVSTSGPCTAAAFAPTTLQGRLQATRVRPILPPGKPSDGRIIVTADTLGRIRVFENNPLLQQWLEPTL